MAEEGTHALLLRAARHHGAELAVVDGALRLTWRQLAARVSRLADALGPHVRAGAPLALCAANSAAALEYLLAAAALGAVFVPLNFRWTGAELAAALADCGARVLVVDGAERLTALARMPGPPAVALDLAILAPGPHEPAEPGLPDVCGCAKRVVRHAQLLAPSPAAARAGRAPGRADEIAALVYTSGTTGGPKGVELSHASCVAHAWQKVELLRLRAAGGPAPVYLSAAPLHHVAGLSASLAVCAAAGCHLIPRSTRPQHLRAALLRGAADGSGGGALLPVDLLVVVPAHLHALVAPAAEASAQASAAVCARAVKTIMIGGGSPTPALARAARAAFPRARLVLSYAATEAGSTITTVELGGSGTFSSITQPRAGELGGLDHHAAAPTAGPLAGGVAVGRAVGIAQVALVPAAADDEEEAAPLPAGAPQPHTRAGELGEIVVRGAGVMRGYYRRPEASAAALRGGWLHTGDLGGFAPDGSLVLLGRRDDVVKTGGENVHAAEVERALCAAHPAVEEAAVVGVADARLGQRLVAVLVPAAGDAADERAVLAACRGALPGFKVPRTLLWWPAERLPRTASGKVVKWRLRAAVADALGLARDEGPRSRL